MTYLLLSVRFLDDRYHGLLSKGGPPEWPPSPFRLFCALVAGVARRDELEGNIGKALAWLQTLDPPIIITPKAKTGQAITRFVPNNDGDKKPERQDRLAAKPTIPTLMLLGPDEKPQVHYIWDMNGKSDAPLDCIRDAARSLTTLGWGVDMAFADAKPATKPDVQTLPGVRWYPKPRVWRDEGMLRVPTSNVDLQECTLCDLKHCHQTAIERIEYGQPLHTVDKPRVFNRIFYASAERPIGLPHRTFELRHHDGTFCAYPQSKLIHIAGMVRHLAIDLMKRDPPRGVDEPARWLRQYVRGHQDPQDKQAGRPHRQFSYLPLPSIGHRHSDQVIRRVMIAAPLGDDDWLQHLAQRLAGQQLVPEQGGEFGEYGPPTLVRVHGDKVARLYTTPANRWASVTPVILPGHDDHKPAKTRKLIEAALAQSGIEQPCQFDWSPFSTFRKSLSAHKYQTDPKTDEKRWQFENVKDYLRGKTWVHLTLAFNDELNVPGPLAIGAGRHCGFGLMAGIDPYPKDR